MNDPNDPNNPHGLPPAGPVPPAQNQAPTPAGFGAPQGQAPGGFGQPPQGAPPQAPAQHQPPQNAGGGFGQPPQGAAGGFGQPPQNPGGGGFGQPPQSPGGGGFGQPPQSPGGGGFGGPPGGPTGGDEVPGGLKMASMILLIVGSILTVIGLIPCLGLLNWLAIPTNTAMCIVGILGLTIGPKMADGKAYNFNLHLAAAIVGGLLVLVSFGRCLVGGGVL